MNILKKNYKGSILITVVSIMTLLILVAMFACMMLMYANKRATVNYYNSQSYVTAKTLVDVYSTYLTANKDSDLIKGVSGGYAGYTEDKQKDLRDVLDGLTAGSWVTLKEDLFGTDENYTGMGEASLSVYKVNDDNFKIKVTCTTGNDSIGMSTATVVRSVAKQYPRGASIFENAVIATKLGDAGMANQFVLGGIVSMDVTRNEYPVASGIVNTGNYYLEGTSSNKKVSFGKEFFLLGMNSRNDLGKEPCLEVDSFYVESKEVDFGNSAPVYICNDANYTIAYQQLKNELQAYDSTKIYDDAYLKSKVVNSTVNQRPFVYIKGDVTIDGNGVYVGYKFDRNGAGDYKESSIDKSQHGVDQMVDFYIEGNLTIKNNKDFYINGDLYVSGSVTGGSGIHLESGSSKQIGINPSSFTNIVKPKYIADDYQYLSNGSSTDTKYILNKNNLRNSAMTNKDLLDTAKQAGNAVNISPYGAGEIIVINKSSNIVGTFKNKQIIVFDVTGSEYKMDSAGIAAGNQDMWVYIPPDAFSSSSTEVSFFVKNNSSYSKQERANVYLYTDIPYTKNIELDNFISYTVDDNDINLINYITSKDITGIRDYIANKVYKVGTIYGTSNTLEEPANLFFLFDCCSESNKNVTIKFTNKNQIMKGYIYAPNVQVNFDQGIEYKNKWNYNAGEYGNTGKSMPYIGSVLCGNVKLQNNSVPLYITPPNSIFEKEALPDDAIWCTSLYSCS